MQQEIREHSPSRDDSLSESRDDPKTTMSTFKGREATGRINEIL